jgi:hypothetical protein
MLYPIELEVLFVLSVGFTVSYKASKKVSTFRHLLGLPAVSSTMAKKIGRRKGARSKGCFFLQGRGCFTKNGKDFVSLTNGMANASEIPRMKSLLSWLTAKFALISAMRKSAWRKCRKVQLTQRSGKSARNISPRSRRKNSSGLTPKALRRHSRIEGSRVTIAFSVEDIACHFSQLEDPRLTDNRKHALASVLVIATMAALAGATGPTSIPDWANI